MRLFITTVFAFAFLAATVFALPSTDGLVMSLHLENNGTDATSYHNDADLVYWYGPLTYTPNCVVGGCFRWEGGYANVSNSPSLDGETDFTLSFWVNSTAVYVTWVQKIYGAPGWGTGVLTGDDYIARLQINAIYGDAVVSDYPNGQFHQVVYSYDHDFIRIYWDGVLNQSGSIGNESISNNLPIIIGANEDLFPDSFFFGQFDEIHLWNRVLSDAEVLTLYNFEKAGNAYPVITPPGPNDPIINGLPTYAAIGYPYYFNASLPSGDNSTAGCNLKAYDGYNMLTKVWSVDGSGFPIRTNRQGQVNDFVMIDDAFVAGDYYNFTLECGLNATGPVAVFIDIPGSSTVNIAFLNSLSWFNERSNESILLAALIIVGLAGAGALYVIFRKRTLWGS